MLKKILRRTPLFGPLRFLKNNVKWSALTKHVTGSALTKRKLAKFDRLHLGCGPRHFEGWANIDLEYGMLWDLTRPLPLDVATIRYVYSEHFIEHVPREVAVQIFTNVKSALRQGGVLRISTPDLKQLAETYLTGKVPDFSAVGWFPPTPCVMVNEAVRDWGHTFIYDERELRLVLEQAGFRDIKRVRWRESEYLDLQNLETRPDLDDLILEAR
jgi:predicted SAM-dependent methyltransferase